MLQNIIEIIFWLCVFIIIYQDFKSRAIYWWLPVFGFFVSFGLVYLKCGEVELKHHLEINLTILLLVLSVLFLYFFIKYRQMSLFFDRFFGLGDVLMLILCAPIFVPTVFLIFFMLMNGLILVVELVKKAIQKTKYANSIPYASYLGIGLILTRLLSFYISGLIFC